MLPFILKWVVAALVTSVLVDVFSKLTHLGDKSRVTVTGRVRDMLRDAWQQHFLKAPSNSDMLLTFVRVNKRRKSLKLLPSFIRFAPYAYCEQCTLLMNRQIRSTPSQQLFPDKCHTRGCECHRRSCSTASYQLVTCCAASVTVACVSRADL